MDFNEFAMTLARGSKDGDLIMEALGAVNKQNNFGYVQEDLVNIYECARNAVGESLRGVRACVNEYLENVKSSQFNINEVSNFVTDRLFSQKPSNASNSSNVIRNNVRSALYLLKQAGTIRAIPKRVGTYEVVETELEIQDWQAADTNPEQIILPFALSNMVELYEGNVILVSGVRNVGKTCVLLNMVKDNMHGYDVSYYNSEGGPTELKKRLTLFEDVPINGWEFEAYARNKDFGHAIELAGNGPKTMHIIDYLEIYEDFWQVGQLVNEIWASLDNGIAVIGIQKPTGRDIPIGGELALDKPRLALALDKGQVTVTKAKSWKGITNPNNLSAYFHILSGSTIKPLGGAYEWTERKKPANT